MIRKVKFPLDMGNDVKVISIEDLQENFNAEKVTEYFLNGKLLTWLEDRYYDAEAEQVKALLEHQDDKELGVKLGKIFGVEVESEIDVEMLKIRKERLEKLRDITSDDDAIHNIDLVAFDQEELGELLDEGKEVIYLCGDKFRIPLSVKNKRYIGVNSPVISFGGNGGINLEENGIVIEKCEFSDNARERMNSQPEPQESELDLFFLENEEENDEDVESDYTDDYVWKNGYRLSKDGTILYRYWGNETSVIIPDTVKIICDGAFMYSEVTDVVLPSGLTAIYERAFAFSSIYNIEIPDSIEFLDYWIFEGTSAWISFRGEEYTPMQFECYVVRTAAY